MGYNQQENNKLFISGIICLVLSLSLIFFSLYLAPNFIWDLHYDIPEFVANQIAYFDNDQEYTTAGSKLIVWLCYFIPGLLFGVASAYISQKIDRVVLHDELNIDTEAEEKEAINVKEELTESAGLGVKIIVLMIAIVVIIFFLEEFVFYTEPPVDY